MTLSREAFVALPAPFHSDETERTVGRLHFQIHTLLDVGIRALVACGLSPAQIVNGSQANTVQDGAGNYLCRVTTVWTDFGDPKPGVTVRLEFSEFATRKVKRC